MLLFGMTRHEHKQAFIDQLQDLLPTIVLSLSTYLGMSADRTVHGGL